MAPSNPTKEIEYRIAFAVTPDDAGAFSVTRAVYVGGQGGNLRVLMANGQDIIFDSVPAGTILPVGIIRVFNTNTTATNIVRFQ